LSSNISEHTDLPTVLMDNEDKCYLADIVNLDTSLR
jgi:hypothetical protein